MTKLRIAACLILVASQIQGQATADSEEAGTPVLANFVVQLVDVKKRRGVFRVALFTNAQDYAVKATDWGQELDASSQELTVRFERVPSSQALVLLYHDLNDNGKLDTNFLGLPKEPYASSVGKRGRFGPPGWNIGVVSAEEGDTLIVISMR